MRARLLLIFTVVPLLGACERSPLFDEGQPWRNRASDYNVSAIPPVYCYETLADANCYSAPQEKETHRMINYVGPAPQTPGYSGH
jgi:hypothetical protein